MYLILDQTATHRVHFSISPLGHTRVWKRRFAKIRLEASGGFRPKDLWSGGHRDGMITQWPPPRGLFIIIYLFIYFCRTWLLNYKPRLSLAKSKTPNQTHTKKNCQLNSITKKASPPPKFVQIGANHQYAVCERSPNNPCSCSMKTQILRHSFKSHWLQQTRQLQ